MPLTPLPEAQGLVLASCEVLPPEVRPLAAAHGHVAAEPVTAPEDVPSFDNTAMDGFAVRAADTIGGDASLALVGALAAGEAPDRGVGPGEAVRIMTGAPMPAGADAVVIVELSETSADGTSVRLHAEATAGEHVRPVGSDLRAGTVVCERGTVLTAAHIGVLASIGVERVLVHRRPRVGLISTGDELVEAPGALRRGQIRDANRPALRACLERDGFEVVDLGILPDREDAVRSGVAAALAECDAVITSGGVSAGDFDYVKLVLAELADAGGGFARSISVAIRPAKPLAFAVVPAPLASSPPAALAARRVPVLGLPGNPVSSLVSYELFARPALRTLAGHRNALRAPVRGVAGVAFPRHADGKLHLDRVVARWSEEGRLVARPSGSRPQASHQLAAMASANALALLPDGEGVAAGADLDLLVLDCP